MLLILLSTLAAAALYCVVVRQYSFWERTSLPHEKPRIPFGSLDEIRQQKRSFGLIIYDLYMRSKAPLVGLYLFFRPAILVRDLELVRSILGADFASFHDRGVYVDERHDPLSANLFALRGQNWRTLRAKLTPSFSSGKLKAMFGTIDEVSEKMVQHLNGLLEGEKGRARVVEVKGILTTYAVDIIGSVIFGLDLDSFANPNNEFRRISNKIFASDSFLQNFLSIAAFVCAPIAKLFRRAGLKDPVLQSVRDLIKRTIEFREKHNVVRRDLLQLLIQLRNTGKISDDDDHIWDVETPADDLKSMSIDVIAAQAFIFYVAGTETTAATTAFTIYELAMYPDLLRRAQDEVLETLKKHNIGRNDKLTYDAVQDMKFLELCVMETTRKYPGLPFLNRECTQDYRVPGADFTIKKGTPIIISLLGIHRDPKYFPDPIKYDPERYSSDNRNYNAAAFMPFGEGPRHCIAQRMGRVNVKVALVKLLLNFDIEPLERRELEFEFHSAPVLVVKGGLKVRLTKRNKNN